MDDIEQLKQRIAALEDRLDDDLEQSMIARGYASRFSALERTLCKLLGTVLNNDQQATLEWRDELRAWIESDVRFGQGDTPGTQWLKELLLLAENAALQHDVHQELASPTTR